MSRTIIYAVTTLFVLFACEANAANLGGTSRWDNSLNYSYPCRDRPAGTAICFSTYAGHDSDAEQGFKPVQAYHYFYKSGGYSGEVCEIHTRLAVPTADASVWRPRGYNGSISFPADTSTFAFGYHTPPHCDLDTQTCSNGSWGCFCREKLLGLGTVGERLFTWTDQSQWRWKDINGQVPGSHVSVTAGIGGVNRTDLPWNVIGVDIVSTDGTDIFRNDSIGSFSGIRAWLEFATSKSMHEGRCNTTADYSHWADCVRGYEGYPYATQEEYNLNIAKIGDDGPAIIAHHFTRLSTTAIECGTGASLSVSFGSSDGIATDDIIAGHANSGATATLWWEPFGSQHNTDNCVNAWNPAQTDSDGDGIGDACDFDYDNSSNDQFEDENIFMSNALVTTSFPDAADMSALTACLGCAYDEACWAGCADKDHDASGSIGQGDVALHSAASTYSGVGLYSTGYDWQGIVPVPYVCGSSPPAGSTILALPIVPHPAGSGLPPVLADEDSEHDWIVEVDDPRSVALARASTKARGLTAQREMRGRAFNGLVMRGKHREARAMLTDPHVVRVFPSVDYHVEVGSWGQDRVDQRDLPLDGIYDTGDGADGTGAHVYVFDTGIDPDHPEFGSRIGDHYDAATQQENSPSIEDGHGHGTHVAGTIASQTYGLATGATVHAVKVCDATGACPLADILDGLNWAIAHAEANGYANAVGNMSLGGGAFLGGSDPQQDYLGPGACAFIAAGHALVVAAGNDSGTDACRKSPARIDLAVTVAASESDDTRASFTNLGQCVDLYAPGRDIVSTDKQGGTRTWSGTSMASPHVAGGVALGRDVIGAASVGKIVDNANSQHADTPTPNRLLYVPEPGRLVLLAAGIGMLWALRRSGDV